MIANAPNMTRCETPVYTRLSSIAASIENYRRGRTASIMVPLWNLRVIHDEFRLAGHADVPEFCRRAETLLVELEGKYGDEANKLINTIHELLNGIRERTPGDLLSMKAPPYGLHTAVCSTVVL